MNYHIRITLRKELYAYFPQKKKKKIFSFLENKEIENYL